jgi:hypothetical protein
LCSSSHADTEARRRSPTSLLPSLCFPLERLHRAFGFLLLEASGRALRGKLVGAEYGSLDSIARVWFLVFPHLLELFCIVWFLAILLKSDPYTIDFINRTQVHLQSSFKQLLITNDRTVN